jgi:hypothetical protein
LFIDVGQKVIKYLNLNKKSRSSGFKVGGLLILLIYLNLGLRKWLKDSLA